MRKKLGRRRYVGLTTLVAVAALMFVPLALAGAISSTTNPAADNPTGILTLCNNGGASANDPNGTGATNCNIYTSKGYVWLSGLPLSASLDPGTYFYAVLDPGGQRNPNDGSAGNLSDDVDPWTNREFTIDGSGTLALANGSTHDLGNNTIRVGLSPDWFADTDNHGDVYILAVCSVPDPVADSPGVRPQDCKYDAFKVSETSTTPSAVPLSASKNATPSFKRTYAWTIDKSVDACDTSVNSAGCSVTGTTKTLNYTVAMTKSTVGDSDWKVEGDISVLNPNGDDVAVSLSDQITTDGTTADANAACTVYKAGTTSFTSANGVGSTETVAAGGYTMFPYRCSYSGGGPSAQSETNVASISWAAQSLSAGDLAAGSTPATAAVDWTNTSPSLVNSSVTVSDLLTSTDPATLPSGFVVGAPVGDNASGSISASATFHYSRTLTVPHGCLTVNNTASFTPTTAVSTSGVYTDSVTAKVCRAAPATGALTMGFWQNKNGQSIITNYCSGTLQSTHTPTSAPQVSLATFLGGYNPYKDFKIGTKTYATTCAGLASYAYDLIKAANASGASMNAMLKAQMLATALDVYFSDQNLGGNRINAPHSIGGINIDLQNICKMIDGTGGTATCSSTYQDVSSAFGGAASMTVSALLTYAAGQSNVGGSTWYLNVKVTQEMAKNAFDAINNQVAFVV